jgi:hypothetical protein
MFSYFLKTQIMKDAIILKHTVIILINVYKKIHYAFAAWILPKILTCVPGPNLKIA